MPTTGQKSIRSRSLAVLVALAAASATLAACGSSSTSKTASTSSSGSTSKTTNASTSSGLEQAKAIVAANLQPPTALSAALTPVGKSVPKGKRIVWLPCGVGGCTEQTANLQAAAHVLGWTLITDNAGNTPATVQAAYSLALRQDPSAVIGIGYPKAEFAPQLTQLAARHIPVVEIGSPDTPGDGILAIVQNAAYLEQAGRLEADWNVAHGGTNVHDLFINFPQTPLNTALANGYEQEQKRLCGSCTYTILNEEETGIGTTLPGVVAGYLRAHPNINYINTDFDAAWTGTLELLQSDGLLKHLVAGSANPQSADLKYIQNGDESYSVVVPQSETFWQAVDDLVRNFAGVPVVDPSGSTVPAAYWFVTKSTVGDIGPAPLYYSLKTYEQDFEKAWGV